MVAVYAPNCVGERWLAPFLDDSKRLVLMGEWNAILDPELDRGGLGASGSYRCENSLIDLLAEHDLRQVSSGSPRTGDVDLARRFALWPDSVLSGQNVRRADSDFVTCPTFHWIGETDHKLVRVSLQLVNRPSLAGYWKFNTSLLEIGDFQERLETLIQPVLVGAVTGNKWWGSLKYRIRNFAIKYG